MSGSKLSKGDMKKIIMDKEQYNTEKKFKEKAWKVQKSRFTYYGY